MGEIVPFPAKQPSKFGFERVGKGGKKDHGQLNLFSSGPAEVLRLPTNIGPFEEALLLDERGDCRAEESYRRAIAEGNLAADAYCNLGIIESRSGRTAKAFDCFTKSLEQDPRHFESHYNLANLYFDNDDLPLAKMHYELASEIDPTHPNLYFNLGLVLSLLDKKREAIEVFVKCRGLASHEERRSVDELICRLSRSLAGSDRDAAL